MKRIISIILVCTILICLLCSCNMGLGMGNYTFEHIHFSNAVEGHCATVEKWYDNETGIEVSTTEYGSLYLSEGSYALFSSADKCPYCK